MCCSWNNNLFKSPELTDSCGRVQLFFFSFRSLDWCFGHVIDEFIYKPYQMSFKSMDIDSIWVYLICVIFPSSIHLLLFYFRTEKKKCVFFFASWTIVSIIRHTLSDNRLFYHVEARTIFESMNMNKRFFFHLLAMRLRSSNTYAHLILIFQNRSFTVESRVFIEHMHTSKLFSRLSTFIPSKTSEQLWNNNLSIGEFILLL